MLRTKKLQTHGVVTWPAVVVDRPVMRHLLSATHSVAAPDRTDVERRKEQEHEEREEQNCPTSEKDWMD